MYLQLQSDDEPEQDSNRENSRTVSDIERTIATALTTQVADSLLLLCFILSTNCIRKQTNIMKAHTQTF